MPSNGKSQLLFAEKLSNGLMYVGEISRENFCRPCCTYTNVLYTALTVKDELNQSFLMFVNLKFFK